MSITERIADFILDTDYQDIPKKAIRTAKQCVCDYVGVTLAGSTQPLAKSVQNYVKRERCRPEATVLGSGIKTSCRNAAFVNGTVGHALDYDDMDCLTIGHPSVTILPALLAISERDRKSGKDLLIAHVVGVEVACKIGGAVNPQHYKMGFHSTSTIGTFGAVAAASKILEMDKEEIVNAFGLAGSLASGLRQNFGTMTKSLHAGRAAENGIITTSLASMGFTSSKEILEGKWGFFNALAHGAPVILEKVVRDLGKPFSIIEPGIDFKRYPSCGNTQSAIDAIISIAKKHNLKPADTTSIKCKTVPSSRDILIYSNPRTGLEGKFSMEFCLALGLLERRVAIKHFTTQKVMDPMVKEVMKKITVSFDEKLETVYGVSLGAIVNVETRDHRSYTERVDFAKGTSRNPMRDEELFWKFTECASLALPIENVKRLNHQLSKLEKMSDVSPLMLETRTV